MNLVQLLYRSVERLPNKECLRFKVDGTYKSLTYAEFWQNIMTFAAGLQQLGVKKGDKIAIMSENCAEWAISDFAILSLGAVVVPIYPTLPTNQATYIIKNADVTWLIAGEGHHIQTVAADWPQTLEGAILIEGAVAPIGHPVYRFPDVSNMGQRAHQGNPMITTDFHQIDAQELATIVHTSGTSGNPKGVMLTHQNITSNVEASLSILPVEETDISLSYLPLSHIFERTVGQYALLSSGATIAYSQGIDYIRDNLAEIRPTILVSVPRLLEKVYTGVKQKLDQAPGIIMKLMRPELKRSSGQGHGISLRLADRLVYSKLREGLGGRIRAVVSGGAGLAKEIAEFYTKAGIPVYEGYGMTESAPVIAANPFGAARPGTVGTPLPGVQVKLADDGELLVRGPNVMLGYYHQEAETAEALADGWLHTGDLAEIVDGYIKIVDRKKNILVLATGKNVAPFPIENAITLSPYIADTVLIGDGRKYVACLVIPDFIALEEKAKEWGLNLNAPETWVDAPPLQRLIQDELRKAIEPFAEFEQPKRAKILPHTFSLESGELTPSLKVKTKLVLQKYKDEVEAMYDGTDYLDIFGNGDVPVIRQTPSTIQTMKAESPVLTKATRPRRRRRWLLIPTAVIIIALLFFGATEAHGLTIPKNLNLLGTIKHIGANTNDINAENAKIVKQLGAVNDMSSITPKIASHLQGLNSGLVSEKKDLHQLTSLSQNEAELSQNLNDLANVLHSDLGSIQSSSGSQAQSVGQLYQLTQQLSQVAGQMTSTNQAIAQKLNTATEKTQQVAQEVP